LPREVLTAEQGYWTAARVPRVATLAGDDESGPAPGDRRRGVSLVTRALRQVIAVLFSLAILLAVSCPALAATSVFLSNDSAGSEVTYVIPLATEPPHPQRRITHAHATDPALAALAGSAQSINRGRRD
jgi:hypothetical protein